VGILSGSVTLTNVEGINFYKDANFFYKQYEWMKTTENPYYEGFFEYGVDEPHCYTGRLTQPERPVEIADFIAAKRPYVAAVPWWRH
jgi:hypothetical protein